MFQKFVNRTFFSFFFPFYFLWLELCASKCCKFFKQLNLFITCRHGFLCNTKTYIQDVYNTNILFSLHEVVYRQIVSIHSYLMVCVWTTKNAGVKPKLRDELMSQKLYLQADVLLSLRKKVREPSEWVVKNQNEFHFDFVNETKTLSFNSDII